MVRATSTAFVVAAVAGSAVYAAPIVDNTQAASACVVDNLQDYQQQFMAGPNTCQVRPQDGRRMFSRFYSNNDWNAIHSLVPRGAKPFVFASGATAEDPNSGGCVQEWLNAGYGNTPSQWDVMLDIGYTADQMCANNEAYADNSTLLVWEGDASDTEAIWATWENVVPYMAKHFGVENPQVTATTMHSKTFAEWAGDEFDNWTRYYNPGDYCTATYSNPAMMQQAMSDPTGLQVRAALYACFSFFDVFTGVGYTYDSHIQGPGKCREYLFPARQIQLIESAAVSFVAPQQPAAQVVPDNAAQADQTATFSLLRRDAEAEPSLLGDASAVDFPTTGDATLSVLPITLAIGKDHIAQEACARLGAPSLVF